MLLYQIVQLQSAKIARKDSTVEQGRTRNCMTLYPGCRIEQELRCSRQDQLVSAQQQQALIAVVHLKKSHENLSIQNQALDK